MVGSTGLERKVALISGAARGMGAATARRFVAAGALVIVADVLDDDGNTLSEELGDGARYVHLDVTREQDWASAVERAVGEFGLPGREPGTGIR
jgi:3alpha(or 20beta)-hydroxysteroid dehydrogenase